MKLPICSDPFASTLEGGEGSANEEQNEGGQGTSSADGERFHFVPVSGIPVLRLNSFLQSLHDDV